MALKLVEAGADLSAQDKVGVTLSCHQDPLILLGPAGWHAGAARGHREEDGERVAEAHRCGLRRVSGGQGGCCC